MTFNVRIVRDDGAEFIIDNTLWGVTEAKGFDKPNITVFTEKRALGDGDLVTGQRVGARDLELKIKTKDVSLNEILRRSTVSYFRPANYYDIYVTRYGVERYAPGCRVTDVEVPTEKLTKPISATLGFLCPGGYMEAAESIINTMSGVVPRLGYPFASLIGVGRIYGENYHATSINVSNEGDADAFCMIVLGATSTVVNPKINVGSKSITLTATMSAGDIIVINPEDYTVTKNRANAMSLVSANSALAELILAVGDNTVSYSATSGGTYLQVSIYHNARFLGV